MKYVVGVVAGILLSLSLAPVVLPEHKSVVDMEKVSYVMMEYRKQIARDDKILGLFMGGQWKRECQIEVFPEEIWADGTME